MSLDVDTLDHVDEPRAGEPGWYRDRSHRGLVRSRWWTGSEWHDLPRSRLRLTPLRQVVCVGAAFIQALAVLVLYIAVAGEPNPTMTAAQNAAADRTEARLVGGSLLVIAALGLVQVIMGWPLLRARLVERRAPFEKS